MTAAPPPPLLALERVTAGQDGLNETIREVTLDLRKGEIMAVTTLDASGGKTTLLLSAAGLIEPLSGAVRFEGKDVAAMSYDEDQRFRARTGVVLEHGGLLENRTILENVAMPLRYHTKLKGRELDLHVERLVRRAGFTEDPRAFPWQVSGRGRRLASLARALARDPSLVIVDRFFEGLDMPDWTRLFEVVLELNRHEGVTWLIAAELDPVLFQLAERVAVLERGKLVGCGTRRELYQDEKIRRAFEASDTATLRRKSERWTSMRRPILAELESRARETLRLDGLLPAPIVARDQATLPPDWREEAMNDADATFFERGSEPPLAPVAREERPADPYATMIADPGEEAPPPPGTVAPVLRGSPGPADPDREPTPATGRVRPRPTSLVDRRPSGEAAGSSPEGGERAVPRSGTLDPFDVPPDADAGDELQEAAPPRPEVAFGEADEPARPADEQPAEKSDTRRAGRLAPRYVPETEWERDVLMGALRDRLEGRTIEEPAPPPAEAELPAGAAPRELQQPPPSPSPTPVATSEGAQPDVLTTIDAIVDAEPREPLAAPRAWSDPAGAPGTPPPTEPVKTDAPPAETEGEGEDAPRSPS